VVVAYPNTGLVQGDHGTVIHHGHFTDSVYQLMTKVSREVYGDDVAPLELEQLEQDNAAWIDFLWSSLGREGEMAKSLRRSYSLLHSDGGKLLLSTRLAVVLGRRARTRLGRRIRQKMLRPLMIHLLNRVHATDIRHRFETKTEATAGVSAYLGGPVARALAADLGASGERPPRALTFVYGHTHRPFASRLAVPGLREPARIYNSGGWVVDGGEPRPATGGGIVVIDGSFDAALIRVATQTRAPHTTHAWVEHADGPDTRGSQVMELARGIVDRRNGPWADAAEAFSNAILRRRAEWHARVSDEFRHVSGMERLALRLDRFWISHRRQRRALRKLRELHQGSVPVTMQMLRA
jgi:hypothetical protein